MFVAKISKLSFPFILRLEKENLEEIPEDEDSDASDDDEYHLDGEEGIMSGDDDAVDTSGEYVPPVESGTMA